MAVHPLRDATRLARRARRHARPADPAGTTDHTYLEAA
jgi:hypothetical protein